MTIEAGHDSAPGSTAGALPEGIKSYDDYLSQDTHGVHPALGEKASIRPPGPVRIPKDRFLSERYAQLEADRLWKRVWQMACRENEIPDAGDYLEYSILDQTVIIVRQRDGAIRAFHNVCPHRGTQLCVGSGNATQFACPFHSWRFDLDGTLADLPARWDFSAVSKEEHSLKEVRTGVWNGFVFLNFDPAAEDLESFIGPDLRRHFEYWPLARRHKVAHVGKIVPGNWKLAIEAFIETYHFSGVHPQTLSFCADLNARYDSYGRHGRMLQANGVASPLLNGYDEQSTVDDMIAQNSAAITSDKVAVENPTVGPGETAREVVAEWMRQTRSKTSGVDYSTKTDAEMLDTISYFLFPNLIPWGGSGFPLVYRVRPVLGDSQRSLFEIMVLAEIPEDSEMPRDVPMRLVPEDVQWADVPELGASGWIFDQDMVALERMKRGLRSSGIEYITLADYQEQTIRGLHEEVDTYLGLPISEPLLHDE